MIAIFKPKNETGPMALTLYRELESDPVFSRFTSPFFKGRAGCHFAWVGSEEMFWRPRLIWSEFNDVVSENDLKCAKNVTQ